MRIRESFSEIFDDLKSRIIKHNLSIEEVSENTGVPEELLEILLNPNNDVIDGISRLFDTMKYRLAYKELVFKAYVFNGKKGQYKVTRVIKPYCSIYYDRSTNEFYKFKMKFKTNKISKTRKQLIMSEMKDFLEESIK